MFEGGQYLEVVYIWEWSVLMDGLHFEVLCIRRWSVFGGCLKWFVSINISLIHICPKTILLDLKFKDSKRMKSQ
jgi:hypothetical protein